MITSSDIYKWTIKTLIILLVATGLYGVTTDVFWACIIGAIVGDLLAKFVGD